MIASAFTEFLIVLVGAAAGGAAGGAAVADGEPKEGLERAEVVKTIEIDKTSFSDIYPAVWLDPARGTIHKLVAKSEEPPVEGALIWIEPNDPEFAVGPKIEGVKLVVAGFGEEVFETLPELKELKRITRVDNVLLRENKKPVVVIESEAGGVLAVVMIENVDTKAKTMRVRWRKLVGG